MQSLPALLLVVAACGPGARETTDDLPAVDGGLDPDALALGCGDSTYLAATAPGADGTWGTSDDVVVTYSWVVDGQPCSDRCVNVID